MNARAKTLGWLVPLLAASCSAPRVSPEPPSDIRRTDPPPASPTPASPPIAKPVEAPDLGEILLGLSLVPPSSSAVVLDDDAVCEREGYPDALSKQAAAELEDGRPGSVVVVVHDEGQTHAEVMGAGCIAPEEYSDSATVLELDQPAGQAPENVSPGLLPYIAPYFAFVGAKPRRSAILAAPQDLKRSPDEDSALRTAIRTVAERVSATHASRCAKKDDFDTTALPLPADILSAADRANTWRLPSPSPTVWVRLEDPALTFGCDPDYNEPEMVGMLIDVATQTAIFQVVANNSVELQWTTDLDGDGTHEALLDVMWLEDGEHEIRLFHHEDGEWQETTLFVSDSP